MQHYSDTIFIKKYPLSCSKLKKRVIMGVPACLVLAGFLGSGVYALIVMSMHLRDHSMHPIILFSSIILTFSIILVANYVYQKHYIKKYFYNMTDKFLIIRKGIFAPQEITVPINRIQDVYIDQDIVDRLLGIYDVHISTATETSTLRAHIDGVDKKIAEELRKRILNEL